jgi:hypothetical protein
VGTDACPVTSDTFLPCVMYNKKAIETGQTHRVTLNWKVDRDHMVYATYSTGYRPGGINRLPQVRPYDADTLSNYEVGVKTSWFKRRLTVNLALFDEEWNKMQIGLTTPGSNGTLSIYNVGSARIRGVEGDASLNLGHLVLSGSGSYTDAKTKSDFCNIGSGGNPDCAEGVYIPGGTRLPVQPKFKGNLTARYTLDLGTYRPYVQASANHQSGTNGYFVQPIVGSSAPWQTAGFTTFDFSLGAKAGSGAGSCSRSTPSTSAASQPQHGVHSLDLRAIRAGLCDQAAGVRHQAGPQVLTMRAARRHRAAGCLSRGGEATGQNRPCQDHQKEARHLHGNDEGYVHPRRCGDDRDQIRASGTGRQIGRQRVHPGHMHQHHGHPPHRDQRQDRAQHARKARAA